MASRQQPESWTAEVNCPICFEFFTDPVTLECGHNYCRSCITQCWANKRINSCPECRAVFPERNPRANRALANLAEKARNRELNPKEKESKLHCEKHQEELKLFCDTDKKLICYTCRDSRDHKSHNFLPIVEAAEMYRDKVKLCLNTALRKKVSTLDTEWQQKQLISEVREQSISLQTRITSEFAKLHQILNEKKTLLIRDLRKQEQHILNTMEKNLSGIQQVR